MEVRTLAELTKFVTRWEVAKAENKEVEKTDVAKAAMAKKAPQKQGKKTDSEYRCFRCGSKKHRIRECTTSSEVVCKNCSKSGHTKDACRSKPNSDNPKKQGKPRRQTSKSEKVKKVTEKKEEEDSSDDDETAGLAMFRVSAVTSKVTDPTPRLRVHVRQGNRKF